MGKKEFEDERAFICCFNSWGMAVIAGLHIADVWSENLTRTSTAGCR